MHNLVTTPFKILVLDCDNTLWQGTAGEDGSDGITLTPANIRLQQWAVDLRAKGILLCLASKNDPDTVAEVFATRTDMPLRPEHIAAQAVSWEDNPVEIAEVRAACPEVLALTLPLFGGRG